MVEAGRQQRKYPRQVRTGRRWPRLVGAAAVTLMAATLSSAALTGPASAAPATGTLTAAAAAPATGATGATGAATRAGTAGGVTTLPAKAALGPYQLRSSFNSRCLDADTNTIGGNGTKVQLWDCYGAGQLNQYWYFETTGTTGLYRIRSRYNSRCLDADSNTIGDDGTKVQLWDCLGGGQYNQYWRLSSTGFAGVYRITSYYNGRCLDADYGTIADNGTRVQLWDCLGDNQYNQDWTFG